MTDTSEQFTAQQAAWSDLKWLLTSPSLIAHLNGAAQSELVGGLIDHSEAELLATLGSSSDEPIPLQSDFRRLGFYAEALYRYYLQHISPAALIAHNVQIQHQGSGKTKGELDFLIATNEGLKHLEMAVKFYLWDSHRKQFIGPNAKDRLDKKLEHLSAHQLPLSQSLEAKRWLSTQGWQGAASSLLLKGVLFHHWQESKPAKPELEQATFTVNPKAQWGIWLRAREWCEFVVQHESCTLHKMPKLAWMGLNPEHEVQVIQQAEPPNINAEPQASSSLLASGPLGMWLCVSRDNTCQRVMVVADPWPEPPKP